MPPSKKNLKGTKKFEKKHLKGVLEQRKASAKVKQRQQIKTKKQSKRTQDAGFYGKDGQANAAGGGKGRKKEGKVGEMSVDDFFAGGFEGLEALEKAGKKGKRKREAVGEEEEEEEDDTGFGGFDEVEEPMGSDSGEDDGDVGMSKKTMEELATKDPEFYKFLKETDPEALDFDENADLAEVDALSEGEDEAEEEEQPKKKRKKSKEAEKDNQIELTSETVAKWKASMVETKSLRAARQIVLAFRCAAHLNEDDAEDGKKQQKFVINSPQVYNDILVTALKHVPEVMNHHLPVKESSSGKLYVPNESKKFKTLSILLKTYAASVIHLLGALADDKTLKLTISALDPLLPYLLSFRKLVKVLIKTVVRHWAQISSSESTKVTAFLILRRLVVIGDKGIREVVLKTAYQGLIGSCRVTNHNTLPSINLLKNTAAELWGIDPSTAYTTAFTFIRQLAIHLRNSIVHTEKKDAYRVVYNWQYTHSLDFWSIVISEHCNPMKEAEMGKESQLRLLIYPLVQVTLGAMRLIPSATFFPLRFHLIRSCLRISRATGTYIPLASPLLEVLNSKEMKNPTKASKLREALDFSVNYRAAESYLGTRSYQDGVGEQVIELFSEFFVLWATNIAFPEFSLAVVIQLKRWLKQSRKMATGNRNSKLGSSLVTLVQKIEANGKFIEGKREKVDFAPKDRRQVEAFLKDFDWEKTPLGAYVSAQRKMRTEKTKLVEEARKEDERKRKEEEEALKDDVDMGSGEEDEEEDGELDVEGTEEEEEGASKSDADSDEDDESDA